MPSFPHLGHSFHYEVSGSGPTVIAIPGMMSDSASWQPISPALERHFQLIRIDPRCSGRSPILPTSVEAVVSDTIALMDHLKIDQAHLISHSMGSRVALELAKSHPERVSKMMLSAVMPRFPALNCAVFESLLSIREKTPGDAWLRALYPWLFAVSFFEDPDQVDAALAASAAYPYAQSLEGMRFQVAALRRGIPVSGLKYLTTPTLALFGTQDRLVPAQSAPEHLSAMPNLTVVAIEGAGHALHWDQPAAVANATLDFLATGDG